MSEEITVTTAGSSQLEGLEKYGRITQMPGWGHCGVELGRSGLWGKGKGVEMAFWEPALFSRNRWAPGRG